MNSASRTDLIEDMFSGCEDRVVVVGLGKVEISAYVQQH